MEMNKDLALKYLRSLNKLDQLQTEKAFLLKKNNELKLKNSIMIQLVSVNTIALVAVFINILHSLSLITWLNFIALLLFIATFIAVICTALERDDV